MAAPKKIKELVERFIRNRDAYLSGGYNEAQVRQEFINPMFIELGWDIYNEAGFAEGYKDVVHEDSLRIGGAHKAPDYSFRVGGKRKFFLEAKKPSVNIKEDIHPAYQTRRYAWSAKLPLSILTDFDEFAVYDCRAEPLKTDKASTARIIYFKHTELVDRWDEIRSIFSKDAVYKGDYDRYVESTKKKRGTAEVDDTFLKEIERWREMLAKNIAIRNGTLDEREINFVLGRTIDRIIFLRMCEDRGVEDYGRLQALQNGTKVYDRLKQLYYLADERFNSGLFHFKEEKDMKEPPDDLSMSVTIDDKPLKDIFKHLYYPDSPFEFSVLPPAILGQVYEQFLGKVIRLTKGHRAVVEYKPEVKKAGGVYYTPEYIVEYIVKNTVEKALEGKNPAAASKLRIVDPACGSGSFLLNAYQFMLDWYIEKYSKNPSKHKKVIYKVNKKEWRLTTAERKRILLTNIYGVDIDAQAVEVTKLSLLLKVLEGETGETLQQSLKLYHERALPDLYENIKCGNSLIGSDFYDNQQLNLLDEEERYRINVFDWETEFSEIFSRKNPGFDVVIGNPPYVRQETLGEQFKKYAKEKFETYAGTADLYVYFVEMSHRILVSGGRFGMICSNKFMRAKYGKNLREYLASKSTIHQIVDFGELPVFKGPASFPAIILTSNMKTKKQNFIYAPIKRITFHSLEDEVKKIGNKLDSRSLEGDNWTLARKEEIEIFEKMKKSSVPLGEYVNGNIFRGILTGYNKAFVIDKATRKRLISEDPRSADIIKQFVIGDDVRKYHVRSKERYLILLPKGWTNERLGHRQNPWKWMQRNYPSISTYLQPFEKEAQKRWDKGDYWWELRACDYYEEFEKPKIVWPEIAKESRFSIAPKSVYLNKTCFFSPINDLYLLGILNSKFIWFYLKRLCSVLGDADRSGRLLQQKIYIETIPVRAIDNNSLRDKKSQNRMIKLVEQRTKNHKELQKAKTSHKKEVIQRQINATDKQIDKLVYKLYDLTEEEIMIIEEGVK